MNTLATHVEFYPLLPPVTHISVPMPDANRILREVDRSGVHTAYATYEHIMDLLESVAGTPNTYNSMRGDINLLLNWAWLVAKKDIINLSITDFGSFIEFGNNPPANLISRYSASLIDESKSDDRYVVVNSHWRPFVKRNPEGTYKRVQASLKIQLSNLSNLYTYFEDIEYSFRNPAAIAMRRMTSSYKSQLRHNREELNDKGLSSLQLEYVFQTVELMAKEDPHKYERSRFLIYFLVFCYPRISECSARAGYSPVMGDFEQHRHFRSNEAYFTYYIPHSKGGKSRKVICSSILIEALTRYRLFLGLSELPTKDEMTPLFIRHKAPKNGREAHQVNANLGSDQIAQLVKEVFGLAGDRMIIDGYLVDGRELHGFTTHSLRHTGIQIDISSGRDKTHIMLDAGHSSEATLRIYTSNRVEFRAESMIKKDIFMSDFLSIN